MPTLSTFFLALMCAQASTSIALALTNAASLTSSTPATISHRTLDSTPLAPRDNNPDTDYTFSLFTFDDCSPASLYTTSFNPDIVGGYDLFPFATASFSLSRDLNKNEFISLCTVTTVPLIKEDFDRDCYVTFFGGGDDTKARTCFHLHQRLPNGDMVIAKVIDVNMGDL